MPVCPANFIRTSNDRNDGSETFLLYNNQQRSVTTTTLESGLQRGVLEPFYLVAAIIVDSGFIRISKTDVAFKIGADPAAATRLMEMLSHHGGLPGHREDVDGLSNMLGGPPTAGPSNLAWTVESLTL